MAGLLAIGFSGVRTFGTTTAIGDLMFVASGLGFAAFTILCERWRVAPLTGAAVISVLSLPFLAVYALWLEPRIGQAPLPIVLAHALNQGVLLVVVGLSIWTFGVRVLGMEIAAWFSPLIPVCGLLLAIPIVGEWPTAGQGAGVLLVVAGLFGLALAHAHRTGRRH